MIYALPYPRFFSQHAGIGGHVAHAYGIIQAFGRAGFAVDVAAEESHEMLHAPGIEPRLLPLGSMSLVRRQIWGWRFVRHLREVRTRETRLCYVRYSAGFAPWIPLVGSAMSGIPLVLEVNSLGSQRMAPLRYIDRFALRAADRIVCVSEVLRDFVLEVLGDEFRDRLLVVPNGVDVERFRVTGRAIRQDGFRIGFAGLLKPEYGLDTLIDGYLRVVSKHPGVVLEIFGDGPIRRELEARARQIAGDRAGDVRVHGPIPFSSMPERLADIDVLVYTTSGKYRFQSPIKLLEYMATGRPIVAAETPQTVELLGSGERGLTFPIGDADALADGIVRLIEDPRLRTALGERARAEAQASHSWDQRLSVVLRSLGESTPSGALSAP